MESISIRQLAGKAKVFGSVISLSGALVYAFVKGPPIKLMNTNPATQNQTAYSVSKTYAVGEWIKGSLIMLSANTTWSMWLVLQVDLISINIFIHVCFFLPSLTLRVFRF